MRKLSFPGLSCFLLLLSYSSLSWFLSHQAVGIPMWIAAIAFAAVQALLLTVQSNRSKLAIYAWLQSDLGYFSAVVVGAMFVAFAFVWAQIFGYIFVVLAAELLARLDLQTIGFNRVQAFIILMLVSSSGLAIGWVASHRIQPWF
ncbi:MAG: hypothetical protein ACFB4J_19250 [Elainellaceae cyanobacterium]